MINNQMIVMVSYARSGGTILNKCLGSMDNVIMISEINPLGGGWGKEREHSYTTVQEQAYHWYGIELSQTSFEGAIQELYEYCVQKEKKLILRDWTFVNFSMHEYNNMKPPGKFLSLDVLNDIGLNPIPFALVRNAIDVWISRGKPDVETFFKEYSRYVDKIIDHHIPWIRYEDFCIDPKGSIQKICQIIGIEYTDAWKNFANFVYVNGDVQLKNSRSNVDKEIKLLKRMSISKEEVDKLYRSEIWQKVNEKLHYDAKIEEVCF